MIASEPESNLEKNIFEKLKSIVLSVNLDHHESVKQQTYLEIQEIVQKLINLSSPQNSEIIQGEEGMSTDFYYFYHFRLEISSWFS